MHGMVACILLALALCATAHAGTGGAEDHQVVELLRDRRFTKGVRPPANGANRLGPGRTCPERWAERLPSTPESPWEFITVAETTRFCDNLQTPSVDEKRIVYASRDGSKRFEIDRATGRVRYVFDTEREWRNGCGLSLPDGGQEPRYLGGQSWNWPHFLLSQDIVDPASPDGRLRLGDYAEATLAFKAELVSSAKGKPAQCPPGSWGDQHIPDHCLFYAALVLDLNRDAPAARHGGAGPARIYALSPLFYSNAGGVYDGPGKPWLGLDPAHAAVYFTGDHVRLAPDRSTEVRIDAQRLAAEAVAAINERSGAGLSPEGYCVQSILIGWEVWGAYSSDVRLSGLSFTAVSP